MLNESYTTSFVKNRIIINNLKEGKPLVEITALLWGSKIIRKDYEKIIKPRSRGLLT